MRSTRIKTILAVQDLDSSDDVTLCHCMKIDLRLEQLEPPKKFQLTLWLPVAFYQMCTFDHFYVSLEERFSKRCQPMVSSASIYEMTSLASGTYARVYFNFG